MLRRISGKRKDKTIKYLVTDSDTITNKTDIAETLATSFAARSSPDHYQEKFRKIRDKEKENTLDFESDNDEKYNVNFSKRELIKSIAQATDSATGPDEINYQFLNICLMYHLICCFYSWMICGNLRISQMDGEKQQWSRSLNLEKIEQILIIIGQ